MDVGLPGYSNYSVPTVGSVLLCVHMARLTEWVGEWDKDKHGAQRTCSKNCDYITAPVK